MDRVWGGSRDEEGVGVRVTSIKITDQISIQLKQTRTREGHYIMYCVEFFPLASYCVT